MNIALWAKSDSLDSTMQQNVTSCTMFTFFTFHISSPNIFSDLPCSFDDDDDQDECSRTRHNSKNLLNIALAAEIGAGLVVFVLSCYCSNSFERALQLIFNHVQAS
jgi:hypothetical protein